MNSALEYVQMALPVCITFGSLFLVIDGKSAKYTRGVRYLGAIMVGTALLTMWLLTSRQDNRISLLEQRIESFETRTPCTP